MDKSLEHIAENGAWDADKYFDAHMAHRRLANADLTTSEGIQNYREITGDEGEDSYHALEAAKKTIVGGLDKYLIKYDKGHAKTLISESGKEGQRRMAAIYTITSKHANTSEDYQETAKRIAEATAEMKAIEESPQEIITQRFGEVDETNWLAKLINNNPEAYLTARVEIAQEQKAHSIEEYGAEKFVKDTYDAAKNLGEKAKEEMQNAQRELEGKINPYQTAEEQAEAMKPFKERIQEIQESYGEAGIANEILKNSRDFVLQNTAQKRAEEARQNAE